MNQTPRTAFCLLALAALCAGTAAQQHRRQPKPGAVQEAYAELIRKLTRATKPPAVKERIRLLRAFLERHGRRHPAAHTLVLKARLRLGRSLLVVEGYSAENPGTVHQRHLSVHVSFFRLFQPSRQDFVPAD